ncbi:alpha-amylase family glycosyl hydrolase [Myxococcus sp. XM-1-1-1]|uniref:alpha-amylase family glycosyl hydrolase n=1 Tax=Myxococcus sp. XM-1-1-1 TaxID=2874602 RepID=UPI001CC05A24|nr:alpha-amylase family glycosyl hydrolase [Myxococcus sp. XM-1-1-1]
MTWRGTLGARPEGKDRTHFRVWAPRRRMVEVSVQGASRPLPLVRDARGYFEGVHPAPVGARYKYRLDDREEFPDPASRFQPDGPHGHSEVVDPWSHAWRDGDWKGLASIQGQVLYELHLGTFTPEGTYEAAIEKLPLLAELGITCLELMPLHTCPGRFNWGYDGAQLFAPHPAYGRPESLRAFVEAAHGLGLGVVLDVVYNHLGPDGNYLAQYAPGYFTKKYENEWGEPTNFDDGEDAGPSREFFVENACAWMAEYHFDGLRLDATQSLYDDGPRHIVQVITQAAREAAGGRGVLIIAENEPQDELCVRAPERGGWGADGLWVDDFHHSARVAATGRAEAYLQDYRGNAQELLSCVLRNSLYQGQYYRWQKKARGCPLWRVPAKRVCLLPPEPRPAGQHARRPPAAPRRRRAPGAGAHDAVALVAPDAHVLHGPGVVRQLPVPLLRGPRAGAAGGGAPGPRRVHRPVRERAPRPRARGVRRARG